MNIQVILGGHQHRFEIPSMKVKCALLSGDEQVLSSLVQKRKGKTEIQRYHSAIKKYIGSYFSYAYVKEIIGHVVIPWLISNTHCEYLNTKSF